MTKTIDNNQDVMDSRDIIARIEELEACDELDEDETTELKALKEFAEQLEGYCEDWTYGVTLIRDSYFEQYARDFAEDIGAIKDDAQWPNTCIDWEKAASELQMDYTSAEFDGVTYWAR